MYFPYLRGKLYEILAIRDTDFLSNLTIPIFEPTSLSKANKARWRQTAESGRRFAIIVNSANGDPLPPPAPREVVDFIDELPPDRVFPALEIRYETEPKLIQAFQSKFHHSTTIVIHRNHQYSASVLANHLGPLTGSAIQVFVDGYVPKAVLHTLPAQRRVLLRDGFQRAEKNAMYPRQSHFDDLLQTFGNQGFDGFGDFSIIGDWFSPGGGPASAVALHLTEIVSDTVVTNHFVSSPPHIRGNPNGKYFSALERLIAYTDGHPQFNTVGVSGFRKSHDVAKYPNLGPPKRWSIQHHFEVVERALRRRGETPII